mgnify:CR=1 FL=1
MDSTVQLALQTIKQKKQAIVFCSSRASAEKTAEEIAVKISSSQVSSYELAQENSLFCASVLSPPTKQCKRLAKILQKEIAFHHSGLSSKQKERIENEFRSGNIKIICATPTLAIGLSLPVFRVICKSLKRFSGRFGMNWIPTLEYLQMAGRAGRPEYESFGEAIAIARNEGEKEEIYQRYICGEPEEIYSKLNVEPVLRMYVLSLISSGVIKDTIQLKEFFSQTFWAHQFGDLAELEIIVEKIIILLQNWNFINKVVFETEQNIKSNIKQPDPTSLFTSALSLVSSSKSNKKKKLQASSIFRSELNLRATTLGRRVSELYLDPLTASEIIERMEYAQNLLKKNISSNLTPFSFLQAISNTIEMQPLLRIKSKEQDQYTAVLLDNYDSLLQSEPDVFSVDYPDFMNSIKTAHFFLEWINESTEDQLFNNMGIRPGEIRVKLENADWLLYSWYELARVLNYKEQFSFLQKLRYRVKNGVKEELLVLMKLKGIGRNRARKLFAGGIKTIQHVKNTNQSDLAAIIGQKIAASLKDQLGQKVEPIKKGKRTGQMSLNKFE